MQRKVLHFYKKRALPIKGAPAKNVSLNQLLSNFHTIGK